MIKHIVWWTLKEYAENATAAENALLLKQRAEALPEKIDALKSIEVSVDIQSTTTVPAQVVLLSSHDDMAGLAAYANHPAHLELGAFVQKIASSRQAIDYAI